MAKGKMMTRKEKSQKNEWQKLFYKNYVDAINKSDFEIAMNCNSFLQRINLYDENEPEKEMKRQMELLYLKDLAVIALYFNTLTNVLSEQSSQMEYTFDIDASVLQVGDTFNNFSELCRKLNIKVPEGKRQREQYKKRFSRFFDFAEMDYSNQIMILEIFEEPIGKNQTYTGKYIKEMQWLILNHLLSIARQNSELLDADGYMEYKTTYSQMLNKELKLISPYLKEHMDEDFLLDSFFTSKFPEYFQQQGAKFNLRFLYNKLYDRVKSALSTALKKLDKLDEMIDLEELYIVKVDDSKNGQWYWKEIHSQKEKTYIKNTRKSVAESLGYKNSWDCLYHGKQNEFEERLFNRVFIEQGWTEVRFRLSIGFNINHILKYIGEYTDVCSYKKILNDAIAFSMNQAALKAYQKDNDKFFQARDAYVIERKRVCVEQTIEEIQEEYDSEYGYNRIFREGFTDSQSLIIGYVVNPDDVRLEELKAYRRDWLKEHLKEYQKERLEDAYNSEELLRDEDELFMDAE